VRMCKYMYSLLIYYTSLLIYIYVCVCMISPPCLGSMIQ
jgi:hypothetical protein